jgi:hypothetical protein
MKIRVRIIILLSIHVSDIVLYLCDVDIVEERMKSIRGSYVVNRNAIKKWEKLPSGSGRQNKRKPKLYKYAGDLHFLSGVISSKPTEDNLARDSEEEHEEILQDSSVVR